MRQFIIYIYSGPLTVFASSQLEKVRYFYRIIQNTSIIRNYNYKPQPAFDL
jgi:hypothetical protein